MLRRMPLPFPRGGGVPGAPDPPTRRLLVNPVYLHGCTCEIWVPSGVIWWCAVALARALGWSLGAIWAQRAGFAACVLVLGVPELETWN